MSVILNILFISRLAVYVTTPSLIGVITRMIDFALALATDYVLDGGGMMPRYWKGYKDSSNAHYYDTDASVKTRGSTCILCLWFPFSYSMARLIIWWIKRTF